AAAELHDRAERRVLRPANERFRVRNAAEPADVATVERVARHRQPEAAADRRRQSADVHLAAAVVDAVLGEVAVEIARPDRRVRRLLAPGAGARDEKAVTGWQRAEVRLVIPGGVAVVQHLIVAGGKLERDDRAAEVGHDLLAEIELEARGADRRDLRDPLPP